MYENKFVKIKQHKTTNEGIVIGCDFEKGITIVDADNPDDILFCITPDTRHKDKIRGIEEYLVKFEIIKKQIENGEIVPTNFYNEFYKKYPDVKHGLATQKFLKTICPFKGKAPAKG